MTDKTTATERLRQLLDERGVEWHGVEGVWWGDFDAMESIWEDDALDVTLYGVSPEQAIEATLGRGTCKVVSKPCDMWECECGKVWWHGGAPNYCPECGRRIES